MLKEVITDLLKNVRERRPEKSEVTIYGNYSTKTKEAVYNDGEEEYTVREDIKSGESVSSVRSFATFIKEELRRRDNTTGNFATATINSKGGIFYADDDFIKGKCEFTRKLSQQWEALASCVDKTLRHEELLRVMQKLSPSIENFHELYIDLLDVRIIGRSEMTSNPIFVDGEATSGYKIKFKMQSGDQEESTLPCYFVCKVPYAKGNYEQMYEVPIELMYLNDGNGHLNILFQCPTFENIEETAMLDEVNYLKDELKKHEDLLVLFNY